MTGDRNVYALSLVLATTAACKKDDRHGNGSPDQVGSVCMVANDCYPAVDHTELQGEVLCLDRVTNGYCTHECVDDLDCCAVEDECFTDLPQVCSPFESTGLRMCFLSCEPDDVQAAGGDDPQVFCQEHVSPEFVCRSSGGGNQNREICVPGVCGLGAACSEDAHCDPGLVCIGDFDGGYCGVPDCGVNADCPNDSVCITNGDINYCAKTCNGDGDCSFCRPGDVAAVCTNEVAYVEAGTTATVCLPPG